MSLHQTKITICQTTRKVLYYSLLWPSPDEELSPRINYKLKLATFFLLTSINNLLLTIHIISLVIKHPDANITEDAAMITSAYGCAYMIAALVQKQKKLAFLLRDLSKFEKFGQPANFGKVNQRLNSWMKFLVAYTFLVLVGYSMVKVFQKPVCIEMNEGRGPLGHYCGLLGAFWIPMEIDYFPIFHVCVIYVTASTYLFMKSPIIVSFTAFEIVQHVVLRIKHLEGMILECFDGESYAESSRKLTRCILYHIEILDFVTRLDDVFFNSMLGYLIITGAACACIEKQIVDGIFVILGACHLLGWIIALFIACIGGQNLLDAALWNSRWYQTDLRLRKNVQIMLMRSQRNLHLRAGSFGVLSYPLFVSVLKMSYSILCMLTS